MPSIHPCEPVSPRRSRSSTHERHQPVAPAGRPGRATPHQPVRTRQRIGGRRSAGPAARATTHAYTRRRTDQSHSMVLLGSSYASARQAATVLPARPLGYRWAGVLANPNHACMTVPRTYTGVAIVRRRSIVNAALTNHLAMIASALRDCRSVDDLLRVLIGALSPPLA